MKVQKNSNKTKFNLGASFVPTSALNNTNSVWMPRSTLNNTAAVFKPKKTQYQPKDVNADANTDESTESNSQGSPSQ